MAVILETERLQFREHSLQYLDDFCAMEADPEVRRYVGGHPRTREAAEEKYRTFVTRPANGFGLWATIYKPENRFIGYCGIGRPCSLGYYLARPYWGRGLGIEAARAFVNFGFDVLDLPRITAAVERGNDRSARLLDKLGFRWVRFEPGERRSFDHYEIVRPLTFAPEQRT